MNIEGKVKEIITKVVNVAFFLMGCWILCALLRYSELYKNNRTMLNVMETGGIAVSVIVLWIYFEKFLAKKIFKINIDKCILYLTIALYFIGQYIFYNIYFRTGWDVWTIDYGAKVLLGKTEPIEWIIGYFGTYNNNILLTWFYAFALKINDLFGVLDVENGQMAIIGINGLLTCITAWLTYWCIREVCNNKVAVLGWGICIYLICLSPWTTIPYSDTLAVVFPIAILTLFIMIEKYKKRWLWGGICFLGIMGFYIKPQVAVVFIAIVLCKVLIGKKEDVKSLMFVMGVSAMGLLAGQFTYNISYSIFVEKIPINEEAAVSWQHFVMTGLNEENSGMWNGNDVNFSQSFQTKNERTKAQVEKIKERLKEHGVKGWLNLASNKTALCFNDGTFGWSRGLGDFYAEVYNEKNKFMSPFLRNVFYFSGKYYPIDATVRNICWLGILILTFWGGIISGKRKSLVMEVLVLTIVGITMFTMLFECNLRQVYCNSPLFIVLGMNGLYLISIYCTNNKMSTLIKKYVKGLMKKE